MGERQPIEADDYSMKPMVTDITNVLPMVTDVYPMVTDVYPMQAKESSVANPQKDAKIDENIRKMQKIWVGNSAFAKELPYSSVLLVKLVDIGAIGGIDEVPVTFSVTDSKVSIGYLMTSATNR
jgi:hypothetical protein